MFFFYKIVSNVLFFVNFALDNERSQYIYIYIYIYIFFSYKILYKTLFFVFFVLYNARARYIYIYIYIYILYTNIMIWFNVNLIGSLKSNSDWIIWNFSSFNWNFNIYRILPNLCLYFIIELCLLMHIYISPLSFLNFVKGWGVRARKDFFYIYIYRYYYTRIYNMLMYT